MIQLWRGLRGDELQSGCWIRLAAACGSVPGNQECDLCRLGHAAERRPCRDCPAKIGSQTGSLRCTGALSGPRLALSLQGICRELSASAGKLCVVGSDNYFACPLVSLTVALMDILCAPTSFYACMRSDHWMQLLARLADRTSFLMIDNDNLHQCSTVVV